MKKILVTTSWDDGHVLDLKLAKLLEQYSLKGTFYVSQAFEPHEALTRENIRMLSENHEVGAHTVHHPNLTKISEAEARKEMIENKLWLEGIIGKDVSMFCYPYGFYNDAVKKVVQGLGFTGARTTEAFSLIPTKDAHALHTTVHAYPFPFRKKDAAHIMWRHALQPLKRNFSRIRSFGIPFSAFRSFRNLAIAAFNTSLETKTPFHLWGHSWEIEKYGLWQELEAVFAYMQSKKDRYEAVTNSALLSSHQ